jgi:hypothetical protein
MHKQRKELLNGKYSRLLSVFFLDPAKLILQINVLHLRHLVGVDMSIIGQSCLLPTRFFLWRDVVATDAIIDVLTLTGKAFEVVRNFCGVDRGRVTSFHLVALFFPARVKQFD